MVNLMQLLLVVFPRLPPSQLPTLDPKFRPALCSSRSQFFLSTQPRFVQQTLPTPTSWSTQILSPPPPSPMMAGCPTPAHTSRWIPTHCSRARMAATEHHQSCSPRAMAMRLAQEVAAQHGPMTTRPNRIQSSCFSWQSCLSCISFSFSFSLF